MSANERAATDADRAYVVIKRGLFWRPEDRGYTSDIDDAGRYTREEALERVHGGEEPVTMELASKYEDTPDAGTWMFTERKGNECYGKNAIECLIHEAPQSNTVAIVALGGPHGTSAAPEAVRAQAQTICDALNRAAHTRQAVSQAVGAATAEMRSALTDCANELHELCKDENDDPEVGIFGWNRCHAVVDTARNILSQSLVGSVETSGSTARSTQVTEGEVNPGAGMGSIPAAIPIKQADSDRESLRACVVRLKEALQDTQEIIDIVRDFEVGEAQARAAIAKAEGRA